METQPSVDSIEEVAVQTSNFAAEFGTAGGAMINMVTKSGTNQYHGSAYDYATNEALNAHQPYTGTRNVVKQHDWGATVGGPVWFPKIYDGRNKTFFFWSYEQFRNKQIIVSNTTTVPLPAYLKGDFSNLLTAESKLITTATGNATDALGRTMSSGTVFDPNTQQVVNGRAVRDPFPGNIVPTSRFDPITQKILPLIPAPLGGNAASGQASSNYQGTANTGRVSGVPSIKFDQNLGSKGRLSFYYQDTHSSSVRSSTGVDALPDNITGSFTSFNSGQTMRLNYDYTVTPRLLLHFGAGWNDSDFGLEAPVNNYDAFKVLGLKGQTTARYFPRIVTAVNANTAIGGMSPLGTTGPTRSFERRPSGNISATYVTGGHTIKFGFEYRRETFPNVIFGNTQGTYAFGANMTEQPSLQGITTNQGFDGFEFASFLLGGISPNSGVLNVTSVNAPIDLANIKSQTALYVQDNWKITRKLTLDYGLRWDYGTYAHEQYGRNGSIGLAVPNPSASGRLGATQYEATCKCNFATNYPYAIGPRLGLAYQIDCKTVLRAGVGVVYNSTSTASGSAAAAASAGSLPANSGQIVGLFKDGLPDSVHITWPSFDPGVGQGVGQVVGDAGSSGPECRPSGASVAVEHRAAARDQPQPGSGGLLRRQPRRLVDGKQPGPAERLEPGYAARLWLQRFHQRDRSEVVDDHCLPPYARPEGDSGRPRHHGPPLCELPHYSDRAPIAAGLSAVHHATDSRVAPLGNTWYDSFQLNVDRAL